jgi:hypothetical protein
MFVGFTLVVSALSELLGGKPPPVDLGFDAFRRDGLGWTITTGLLGGAILWTSVGRRTRRHPGRLIILLVVGMLAATVAAIDTGSWVGVLVCTALALTLWAAGAGPSPAPKHDGEGASSTVIGGTHG